MRTRLWLLAPALVLYLLDVGLTLQGQSAAFWAGDYSTAVEANPIAKPLLAQSPWLFVLVASAWLFALSWLILVWRHPVTIWLAVILALVHAVAGATWLTRIGLWGWIAAIIYIAVAAQASAWCWRRFVGYSGVVTVPQCK